MRAIGLGRARAQEQDEAAAAWSAGYRGCGPGYGFLGMLGALDAESDPDGAARLAGRELSERDSLPGAFRLLLELWPRLTEATRAELAALGSDPARPLHLPDPGAKAVWAERVLCAGPATLREDGPRTEVTCASGPQSRYFVLDALPMDPSMM